MEGTLLKQVSRGLRNVPIVVVEGVDLVASNARHYQHVLAENGPLGLARSATADVVRGSVLVVRGGGRLAGSLLPGVGRGASTEPERPPAVESADAIVAGAPGVATETAQRESARLQTVAGEDLAPHELPIDDYDHLTLGALRARLPRLTVDELLDLRAYEQAHANRLPIVTMLENRIAKLRRAAPEPEPTGI
jgi:hypothetical protein